ncbi:unnamed protein product [Cuscuta campestris]|uniref:Snf2 ATP coupling domain-containing protein n=1 Tax=Cuscuta campestris TaxID=132261 RepID=A0A484L5H8_9ASTE|nr:unnamed protein product [Cuscuta campestris]
MIAWKKVCSEKGAESSESVSPLPSRLVTEEELKPFYKAMKISEAPSAVPSTGIKRKSHSLGGLDTQHYGRGKRAREVRSYEEQWTEEEFEKMCLVESPESPVVKYEISENNLSTGGGSAMSNAEGKVLTSLQPSEQAPLPIAQHSTLLQPSQQTPVPLAQQSTLLLHSQQTPVPMGQHSTFLQPSQNTPVPVAQYNTLLQPSQQIPVAIVQHSTLSQPSHQTPVPIAQHSILHHASQQTPVPIAQHDPLLQPSQQTPAPVTQHNTFPQPSQQALVPIAPHDKDATPPTKRGRGRPKRTSTVSNVSSSPITPHGIKEADSLITASHMQNISSCHVSLASHPDPSSSVEGVPGNIQQSSTNIIPNPQSLSLPVPVSQPNPLGNPTPGRGRGRGQGRGRKSQIGEVSRGRGKKQKTIGQGVSICPGNSENVTQAITVSSSSRTNDQDLDPHVTIENEDAKVPSSVVPALPASASKELIVSALPAAASSASKELITVSPALASASAGKDEISISPSVVSSPQNKISGSYSTVPVILCTPAESFYRTGSESAPIPFSPPVLDHASLDKCTTTGNVGEQDCDYQLGLTSKPTTSMPLTNTDSNISAPISQIEDAPRRGKKQNRIIQSASVFSGNPENVAQAIAISRSPSRTNDQDLFPHLSIEKETTKGPSSATPNLPVSAIKEPTVVSALTVAPSSASKELITVSHCLTSAGKVESSSPAVVLSRGSKVSGSYSTVPVILSPPAENKFKTGLERASIPLSPSVVDHSSLDKSSTIKNVGDHDCGNQLTLTSAPTAFIPLLNTGSSISGPISTAKQGRGRGRKPQTRGEAPRRRGKGQDLVTTLGSEAPADQTLEVSEPPPKKSRISVGRKPTTRSKHENEVLLQKNLLKPVTSEITEDCRSQEIYNPSCNSEVEQQRAFTSYPSYAGISPTGQEFNVASVDDNISSRRELYSESQVSQSQTDEKFRGDDCSNAPGNDITSESATVAFQCSSIAVQCVEIKQDSAPMKEVTLGALKKIESPKSHEVELDSSEAMGKDASSKPSFVENRSDESQSIEEGASTTFCSHSSNQASKMEKLTSLFSAPAHAEIRVDDLDKKGFKELRGGNVTATGGTLDISKLESDEPSTNNTIVSKCLVIEEENNPNKSVRKELCKEDPALEVTSISKTKVIDNLDCMNSFASPSSETDVLISVIPVTDLAIQSSRKFDVGEAMRDFTNDSSGTEKDQTPNVPATNLQSERQITVSLSDKFDNDVDAHTHKLKNDVSKGVVNPDVNELPLCSSLHVSQFQSGMEVTVAECATSSSARCHSVESPEIENCNTEIIGSQHRQNLQTSVCQSIPETSLADQPSESGDPTKLVPLCESDKDLVGEVEKKNLYLVNSEANSSEQCIVTDTLKGHTEHQVVKENIGSVLNDAADSYNASPSCITASFEHKPEQIVKETVESDQFGIAECIAVESRDDDQSEIAECIAVPMSSSIDDLAVDEPESKTSETKEENQMQTSDLVISDQIQVVGSRVSFVAEHIAVDVTGRGVYDSSEGISHPEDLAPGENSGSPCRVDSVQVQEQLRPELSEDMSHPLSRESKRSIAPWVFKKISEEVPISGNMDTLEVRVVTEADTSDIPSKEESSFAVPEKFSEQYTTTESSGTKQTLEEVESESATQATAVDSRYLATDENSENLCRVQSAQPINALGKSESELETKLISENLKRDVVEVGNSVKDVVAAKNSETPYVECTVLEISSNPNAVEIIGPELHGVDRDAETKSQLKQIFDIVDTEAVIKNTAVEDGSLTTVAAAKTDVSGPELCTATRPSEIAETEIVRDDTSVEGAALATTLDSEMASENIETNIVGVKASVDDGALAATEISENPSEKDVRAQEKKRTESGEEHEPTSVAFRNEVDIKQTPQKPETVITILDAGVAEAPTLLESVSHDIFAVKTLQNKISDGNGDASDHESNEHQISPVDGTSRDEVIQIAVEASKTDTVKETVSDVGECSATAGEG